MTRGFREPGSGVARLRAWTRASCVFASAFRSLTGLSVRLAARAARVDARRSHHVERGRRSRFTEAASADCSSIGELALALILLAGAGDLMKSFLRISARPEGTDERDLLSGADRVSRREVSRTRRDCASRRPRSASGSSAFPGALSATVVFTGFIAGFGGHDERFVSKGSRRSRPISSPRFYFAVTPGYFATMRLPLIAGRRFTAPIAPVPSASC